MQAFTTLTGLAAALPDANIDTDQVIPAQFLKTISRKGLGRGLFYSYRHDAGGRAVPGFVLDTPPWTGATILVAGDNFGCGSSREHAPWALLDVGIRCVIATSFGDIFYNNSVANGLLPVRLDAGAVAELMAVAEAGGTVTVDLEACEVRAGARAWPFAIAPAIRADLLAGADAIAKTETHAAAIAATQAALAAAMPWLPAPVNS